MTFKASVIIADARGIRRNAIAATAKLIKHLENNAPASGGNFNVTASAMVDPLNPYFPAAYHDGPGKQISVGLQSANVVMDDASPPDYGL